MKTIDDRLKWTIGSENFDGSKLKPSTDGLTGLLSFIAQHPDSELMVEGHTDSLGAENHNRIQSQGWADAVMAYLVQNGIASSRLTGVGRGCRHPVAGNHSAAGRRRNARVEVIIRTSVA